MIRAILVSLRPHQWTKNLLVFAALALSKHLFEREAFLRALLAFAIFCGLSGTIYVINDLTDLARDRLHPRKKHRPLASGALSPGAARGVAGGLGLACLGLSWLLGWDFALAALLYTLLNLAYSFRLKEIVIVDVLSISMGFLLRGVAGALAISVQFSDWLIVCTILLALFLALDQMIGVVTASCLMAYAFYTMAPETVEKYRTDRLAWTIPFVLYGIFRYLYLVHQRDQGGSPTDLLLTDRPLLVDVALWALSIVLIVYTAGGAPMPRTR